MNCPLCGAELKPYESLCSSCRDKKENSPAAKPIFPDVSFPQTPQNAMTGSPEDGTEADLPAYLRSGYSVTDEPGKPGIFRRYRKQLIISLIIFLLAAGGAITAFLIIEANKPGYMSITAAAEHEMELMNEHNWDAIFSEVSDEEMEMVFEYYKEGLIENNIPDAVSLRQNIMLFAAISQTMNGWHDMSLDAKKSPLIEENIQSSTYYLASREGLAKHWYRRVNHDGEVHSASMFFYKKDGRWFSLNGLKLSDIVARGISDHSEKEE